MLFREKNCGEKIFFILLQSVNGLLTDGVTVALQFLELSVQVRILVGQLIPVKATRLTLNKIRRNALNTGTFVFFRLKLFKVTFHSYRIRKSTIESIKKFSNKDLAFSSIDHKFIKSLHAHLVKEGKSESTLARTQKLIRTMFNRAIKQGLVNENPMDAFRIKEASGEREFLHPDELKKLVDLYNHRDTDLTLKKALRVFLFCCNTGLRYRDIENLKFKNIVSTIENGIEKHKLRFIMHKTKDWIEIPLNETALRLLPDKTFDEDYVFHVYSNQPMTFVFFSTIVEVRRICLLGIMIILIRPQAEKVCQDGLR